VHSNLSNCCTNYTSIGSFSDAERGEDAVEISSALVAVMASMDPERSKIQQQHSCGMPARRGAAFRVPGGFAQQLLVAQLVMKPVSCSKAPLGARPRESLREVEAMPSPSGRKRKLGFRTCPELGRTCCGYQMAALRLARASAPGPGRQALRNVHYHQRQIASAMA